MKQSIYILIILIPFITSCKSLSKIRNKSIEIENIKESNYQKFNGTYSNNSDTIIGKINHYPFDGISDIQRLTILSQLILFFPEAAWRDENNQIIDSKDKWIKMEFKSNKQAIISFYHKEKFVFSKNIHGKFKNGYFYLRPKIFVIPFFPLVFGYNFERARIGKTKDDRLLIDYKVSRWGFALVAGSEDNGVASTIFKKKNN